MKILIVSNQDTVNRDKLVQVLQHIDASHNIYGLYEDISLRKILGDDNRITWVHSLPGTSDRFLWNKEHTDLNPVSQLQELEDKVYKAAIKRYPAPSRADSYDDLEFEAARHSVSNSRMRHVMNSFIKDIPCIIHFYTKDYSASLIRTLQPEFGDGKYLYSYNCINDKCDCTIGGIEVTEEVFLDVLERGSYNG